MEDAIPIDSVGAPHTGAIIILVTIENDRQENHMEILGRSLSGQPKEHQMSFKDFSAAQDIPKQNKPDDKARTAPAQPAVLPEKAPAAEPPAKS